VDLYTRRQLTLLLIVVLVAGAGIGIDRWRRAHPDVVERLEALDRRPAPAPPRVEPPRIVPPRPPRAGPIAATGTTARGAAPLDLNRASAGDLERLPGIGPGLAARIVDARDRRGAFETVDDLRRVRGIGATTFARVRPLIAIGPAP
jgi:competence ComEA-like helix-hairpin-helix protein